MGSIFYPKHLKNLYESNLKKTEIEVIHSCLYRFTKKKLSHLESYGAYHFLINHFHLKNKETLLNINYKRFDNCESNSSSESPTSQPLNSSGKDTRNSELANSQSQRNQSVLQLSHSLPHSSEE